jgi:hypothetical protein
MSLVSDPRTVFCPMGVTSARALRIRARCDEFSKGEVRGGRRCAFQKGHIGFETRVRTCLSSCFSRRVNDAVSSCAAETDPTPRGRTAGHVSENATGASGNIGAWRSGRKCDKRGFQSFAAERVFRLFSTIKSRRRRTRAAAMAYQQMRDAGAQYRKGAVPTAQPVFNSYETQYDVGYDNPGYQQGGLRPPRSQQVSAQSTS